MRRGPQPGEDRWPGGGVTSAVPARLMGRPLRCPGGTIAHPERPRTASGRMAWRGDVDDVVDIRIQRRRVEYRSGQALRDGCYDLRGNGMPRRPVTLDLNVSRGRGDVIVVQQPSGSNGYTAMVRVVDLRSGYGDYDFDLRRY